MRKWFFKKLRVGYADVSIETIDKKTLAELDEHICGKYFGTDHRIIIADGLTRFNRVNTIIHELGHAIAEMFNITFHNEESEENFMGGYANGITSLMRDEPKFFLWCLSQVTEPEQYAEMLEEELDEISGNTKSVARRRKD